MTNERHRTLDRQTVVPSDEAAARETGEQPVVIDVERMAVALAGESISIPRGLGREELRAYLVAASKTAR